MADIAAVRDGLKTLLGAIAGLRAYDLVPDRVETPAAIVMGPGIQYDVTMGRGCDRLNFTVRVLVSRATDRHAQRKLDGYIDTVAAAARLVTDRGEFIATDEGAFLVAGAVETGLSIKTAIEADPTIGGTAMTARVQRAEGYGMYEVAGVTYLGADFKVEVLASG